MLAQFNSRRNGILLRKEVWGKAPGNPLTGSVARLRKCPKGSGRQLWALCAQPWPSQQSLCASCPTQVKIEFIYQNGVVPSLAKVNGYIYICNGSSFVSLSYHCSQPFEAWKVVDWGNPLWLWFSSVVGNSMSQAVCFNQRAFYPCRATK